MGFGNTSTVPSRGVVRSHFGGRDSRIVINAIERQCILFLTFNRIFAYTTSGAWVLFLSIEDALNIYFISLQINYLRGE